MNYRDLQDIEGSILHLKADISEKQPPMCLFFGGMGNAGVPAPFSFVNMTKNMLDVERIYLRDLDRAWYHAGLRGITENISETALFLQSKIEEIKPKKIVTVGNSMGGYAAILFGVLLKADVVHAFVPNTLIDGTAPISYKELLQKLHENYDNTFYDLKKVMEPSGYQGEVNIFYDCTFPKDTKHANNLANFENVRFHTYEEGKHQVIKILKETGQLKKIILNSLL